VTTVETWLSDPDNVGIWTVMPEQSSITFTTRSFWGLVPVKGTFSEFSGQGHLTTDGEVSSTLEIKAASLQTGIGKRDAHLRSPDFFDVDNFPLITVEVTALAASSGSSADVAATLTVRGITKPLALHTTVNVRADGAVAISARGKIDRTQFEVSGNMLGMIGPTTTLLAETVFAKSR
jgi:polyisoprenoid-binding protein YceI